METEMSAAELEALAAVAGPAPAFDFTAQAAPATLG